MFTGLCSRRIFGLLGLPSLAVVAFLALSQTGWALTVEKTLDPAYAKEHPGEWSVKVDSAPDGLVKFTVVRSLDAPKYLVAHLAIYHKGKLIATSDSPAYGRKHDNTFYFSVNRDDLAESKFSLSQSELGGSGDDAVPVPGTIIYQLPLSDFLNAATANGPIID